MDNFQHTKAAVFYQAIVGALCALFVALLIVSSPALAAKEYVLNSSFGSEGTGNGEFREPAGIAVNGSNELMQPAAGDVYVVDVENSRIERFSAEGAYISQFDGSATPTGGFSFEAGSAIAVDNSGNTMDPSLGDIYIEDNGDR